MANDTSPIQTGTAADPDQNRSLRRRYLQPLIAFLVLFAICAWTIAETQEIWMIAGPPHHTNAAAMNTNVLWIIGRALSEHWDSIYNCMLAASGVLLLIVSRVTKKPALAWRVWDLATCCTIMSLGFKLVPLPRPGGGMHGFPSGHTLTAFAAACLLMNTYPRVAPYAFVIAVAVGWSRVEIHEHFMYQVIVGALFGILIGALVSHARDDVGIVLPRAIRACLPASRAPDSRNGMSSG